MIARPNYLRMSVTMFFNVLFLMLTAPWPAFGYGHTSSSGSGSVGSCAWNQPPFQDKELCWISQESQAGRTSSGPGTSSSNDTAETEITGWEGPGHCVREYCVYSNRHFCRGIVVITNRENAKEIFELPDVTTSAAAASTHSPPFYATEIPGKGIGLVANRTIKRGEPIMVWQPTFMVHAKLTEALSPEEHRHVLDAALLKLPAARRRAFSRQLGQFGGHRVSDILLTNSFQVAVGGDREDEAQAGQGQGQGHHLGSFPDVSRINHDCRPNLAFRIDEHLAHRTHAVRDIYAGEELTLSYMNPFEAHAVRQRHILQSWGFACTCQHCAMSGDEIRASDARLDEMDELEAELGNFASNKASVAMVERLLDLYEKERLYAKTNGAYVLAALNYNLFGDAKNAKKYAQLAVETGIVEFGPEADDVKAMEMLAKSPKDHFTWKKRTAA